MLSIIVPVRNESENLKDVFDYYTKNVKDFKYEVLIVNDFSKDDTLNAVSYTHLTLPTILRV